MLPSLSALSDDNRAGGEERVAAGVLEMRGPLNMMRLKQRVTECVADIVSVKKQKASKPAVGCERGSTPEEEWSNDKIR